MPPQRHPARRVEVIGNSSERTIEPELFLHEYTPTIEDCAGGNTDPMPCLKVVRRRRVTMAEVITISVGDHEVCPRDVHLRVLVEIFCDGPERSWEILLFTIQLRESIHG